MSIYCPDCGYRNWKDARCGDCDHVIKTQESCNRWISVKDRLPPIGLRVLVYACHGVHGGDIIDIEYRVDDTFWSEDGVYSSITHWMSLPEAPHE